MDAKLTLSLNSDIIERAKKYAKKKNISLSSLIESYLDKVSSKEREGPEISPLVKSLSGIISLPKNHDPKKDYGNFLAKKYKVR
jgi:macrodomain Ter protein organizer (MatP/YcbG family)